MDSTTVKLPCATTSRKRTPLINDRQTKTPKFFPANASTKRPPPVSDRDRDFLGLKINDFLLFLTSCTRPLESVFYLYFRCVHCVTWNIRRTSVTTWNYAYTNLDMTEMIFHKVVPGPLTWPNYTHSLLLTILTYSPFPPANNRY